MPKLTLSIDAKIIKEAKELATRQGTSVSALFERVIRLMVHSPQDHGNAGPITRELTGIIDVQNNKTYRELVEDALVERTRQ